MHKNDERLKLFSLGSSIFRGKAKQLKLFSIWTRRKLGSNWLDLHIGKRTHSSAVKDNYVQETVVKKGFWESLKSLAPKVSVGIKIQDISIGPDWPLWPMNCWTLNIQHCFPPNSLTNSCIFCTGLIHFFCWEGEKHHLITRSRYSCWLPSLHWAWEDGDAVAESNPELCYPAQRQSYFTLLLTAAGKTQIQPSQH